MQPDKNKNNIRETDKIYKKIDKQTNTILENQEGSLTNLQKETHRQQRARKARHNRDNLQQRKTISFTKKGFSKNYQIFFYCLL